MSNLTKAEFRKPGADQWAYIATPAHMIYANFHMSLVRSIPPLLDAGISVTYAHLAGHCHVDDARNLLVADFLKTKCTDLLFWDADVAAQPDAASRLLRHTDAIVAGVYPLKELATRFPVRLNGSGVRGGPLPAEAVPTGFLRIRRAVLELLAEQADKLRMDGQIVPVIFERGAMHGDRIGGDMNFCRRATAAGFAIFVDPTLLFTHCGPVDFAGRLADHI